MTDKKKKSKIGLLSIILAVVFISIFYMFPRGLSNNSRELDLAVKDKEIVEFSLPDLYSGENITNADLKSDKPYYLVNFWGSWCPSCYQEHKFLLKLAKTEFIYGVNWKDSKEAGQAFIIENGGNPFKKIMVDDDSLLAIGMGVYGAPETFLVKTNGTILYRYAGVLTQEVWDAEFIPLIKKIKNKK